MRSFVRACSSLIAVALISASLDCRSARSSSRSPVRNEMKYWDSANPPTAAAIISANTISTGPRRVFLVIGCPRSRSRSSLRQEIRSWIKAVITVARAPTAAAIRESEGCEKSIGAQ